MGSGGRKIELIESRGLFVERAPAPPGARSTFAASRKHLRQTPMPPLVSIVTLNWNQAEVTCALLDTLRDVTYPNLEVIVVDNGSRPEDAALLRERHPWIRLIENGRNEGFTGGNNVGIQASRGDYVLLLNNDTEVPAGFLEPLIEAMENDPAIGIASPKIRFHYAPDTIQYAGCDAINRYTGRGRLTGFGQIDRGQHDRSGRTELAHGAAMLIRRSVFERIGLLSDLFFIYYEEFDFTERTRRAGFEVQYVAESLVMHKESVTVGKENAFKTYYMTRNRLLFLRRNLFGASFWLALSFFLAISVPANTLRFILRRRFDLLGAFWRGLVWHLVPRSVHRNPGLRRVVLSKPVTAEVFA